MHLLKKFIQKHANTEMQGISILLYTEICKKFKH